MDDFTIDDPDRFSHGQGARLNRNDQGRGELAVVSVDHGLRRFLVSVTGS